MSSWVNWDALWKIVVVGLLAGAGLPAVFALGLRLLNPPNPQNPTGAQQGEEGGATGTVAGAAASATGPLSYAAAGICFAVVLAAIGWGIESIINHS